MGLFIMHKKNNINYLVFPILLFLLTCSPNPRIFDVILYNNQIYDKTNSAEILIVSSRLEIKDKYFEIGVIKATEKTQLDYIKKIAAENGANIIIDEGNLNFTLVRYKNQKNKESNNEENIKT